MSQHKQYLLENLISDFINIKHTISYLCIKNDDGAYIPLMNHKMNLKINFCIINKLKSSNNRRVTITEESFYGQYIREKQRVIKRKGVELHSFNQTNLCLFDLDQYSNTDNDDLKDCVKLPELIRYLQDLYYHQGNLPLIWRKGKQTFPLLYNDTYLMNYPDNKNSIVFLENKLTWNDVY